MICHIPEFHGSKNRIKNIVYVCKHIFLLFSQQVTTVFFFTIISDFFYEQVDKSRITEVE